MRDVSSAPHLRRPGGWNGHGCHQCSKDFRERTHRFLDVRYLLTQEIILESIYRSLICMN